MRAELRHDSQRKAGARVDIIEIRREEAHGLRDHPCADGEIGSVEPVQQRIGRNRQQGRQDDAQADREKRIDAELQRQNIKGISAGADEGLRADRDEPGISREQIPHLRDREVAAEFDDPPHRSGIGPPRHRDDQDDRQHAERKRDAARRCLTFDAHRREWDGLCASDVEDSVRHGPQAPLNRPRGLVASTARKTTWPASTPQPGSIRKPTACATPRTVEPRKAPQIEPRPPMITASKA